MMYIDKVFIICLFGMYSLSVLQAQDMATSYLKHHKDYINAIISIKRGKCDDANVQLTDHANQLLESEKDHYRKRADELLSSCIPSNQNVTSVTRQNNFAYMSSNKIKRPRRLVSPTKQIAKPVVRQLEKTQAVVMEEENKSKIDNKLESYGVKFATRSEKDHPYISLQDFGPIISVLNKGKYDYYISSIDKKSEAHQVAQQLVDQGYKEVSTYTLINGIPIKELRKYSIATEGENQADKNAAKGDCAIIVHSFKNQMNIEKMKSDISDAGYPVFIERVGEFYRVGVSAPCEESELAILLNNLREKFNQKAWIRR